MALLVCMMSGSRWRDTTQLHHYYTKPNDLVANVHDRMPVIMDNKAVDIWLDPDVTDKRPLLMKVKVQISSKIILFLCVTLVVLVVFFILDVLLKKKTAKIQKIGGGCTKISGLVFCYKNAAHLSPHDRDTQNQKEPITMNDLF